MLIEESKHLCMMPWTHAGVSQDGEFSICCYAHSSLGGQRLDDVSVQDARNAGPIREMRLAMMRDEPSQHCSVCYDYESSGSSSPRTRANRFFAASAGLVDRTRPDGSVVTPLQSLDVRFSNICNLRCRTCGPHDSTSWQAEAKALGLPGVTGALHLEKTVPEWDERVRSILPSVQLIYFAGGEPLLDPSHHDFLETLLELGRDDMILDYNSNLTALRCGKREIIPLWKKFRTVQIGASLDGAGPQFEYLRKGAVWSEVLANHRRLKAEVAQLRFYINATVSVMNVFHLPAAILEWLRLGLIHWPDELNLNFVRRPAHFSIGILNAGERQRLADSYESFMKTLPPETHLLHRTAIQRALNSAMATARIFGSGMGTGKGQEALRAKFREITRQLDALRNERLEDLFPELSGLMSGSSH